MGDDRWCIHRHGRGFCPACSEMGLKRGLPPGEGFYTEPMMVEEDERKSEARLNLMKIWDRHGLPGKVQLGLYGTPDIVVCINLNEVEELAEILRDRLRRE